MHLPFFLFESLLGTLTTGEFKVSLVELGLIRSCNSDSESSDFESSEDEVKTSLTVSLVG